MNGVRDRRLVYGRWFGPVTTCVAWAAIVLAIAHPPHGTGRTICWVKSLTDLPCPGCGLTRSLSSAARGMFGESVHYHAFGLPLLMLLAFIALAGVMPARRRRRFAALVMRHPRPVHLAFVAFVAAFVVYGVVRAVLSAAAG